jgi:hypothetical protein
MLLKEKSIRLLLLSLKTRLDEHQGTWFMEQSSTPWEMGEDGENDLLLWLS